MADEHLLSGLKQFRGETLGRISAIDRQLEALERERDEAFAALRHIDAVLLLKDPDVELDAIRARRPKGSLVSTRGDGRRVPVTQAILKLLRQRGVPMSVEEVAEALAADYPAKDAAKLKVSARTFLSSKKSEGVLTGAQNDKGVLAYGFPAHQLKALPRQAA